MSGIFLPQRALRQKPPAGSRYNPGCPLAQGLQCLYAFNEGGGNAFAEASGQHPAASLVGGSGTCWSNGFSGGWGGPSIQLTSTIGYANAGNICDNLANFTVSLWFKTTASPTNACIVGKFGSGGFASGQGWGIFHAGGEFVSITQLSGGSTYRQLNTSSSYNDGHWHHGVFTVSNYLPQKIYINGVSVGTTPSGSGTVTTTTTTSNLQFGADNGTGDFWNGFLDVVGVWNRVLGSDEIERLYVEPFCFISPGGQTFFSKARIVKKVGAIQSVTPDGILSQEAPGAQGIAASLLPRGIITQETFGASTAATNNASNLFPAGIPTKEAEGAILFSEGVGPTGITSGEAEGKPIIGLNLLPLGLTANELFGALKAAVANRAPINIPLRRRPAFNKPPLGAMLNAAHPLAQGLAAGWILNDGGSFAATELVSGARNSFGGSPSVPAWVDGQFGAAVHFPGGSSGGRIAVAEQAAFTDLGLNGPMSVSFWYNYDAAQLALAAGSSVMGKNDSTDGVSGNTHGWVINSDNWHLVSGSPVNSGPQNIKLEFERSLNNKQGGIPAPTNAGIWHHIVITTVGGASTPSVNDYAVYLDGALQQNIFFVAGTGDPTTNDSGYNLAIGSHPSGTNPFAGSLDTVLLYNRVLSSAEAQLLYTDPFCFMHKRRQRMRATHPTGSLQVTPLGIVSAGQLGAMRAQTTQSISALGITSGEKLGALQAAIASVQALYPGAILSLESLGNSAIIATPMATPSNRILTPAQQYRIFNLKIEERIL